MSVDTIEQTNPELEVKPELTVEQQKQVERLGSAFHEQWRQTRLNEQGGFEPRVKSTSDSAWIEAHGTDQVDIANTSFAELPSDWQAENAAAAETVVRIIAKYPEGIDLGDVDTAVAVGDQIHSAWLARNEWAKDGELGAAFLDLSPAEQDKDIAQMRTAINMGMAGFGEKWQQGYARDLVRACEANPDTVPITVRKKIADGETTLEDWAKGGAAYVADREEENVRQYGQASPSISYYS